MIRYVLLCLFCLPAVYSWSQPIARLEVDISRPMNGIAVPAEVDLDAITFIPDSALELWNAQAGNPIPVPFQVDETGRRTLHWMVDPQPGKKAIFMLQKKMAFERYIFSNSIRAIAKDGELTISNGDQHLLQYVYKTVYPPAGIDTAYKRSGFIHPLWSPRGQVLTRIQAPDHYHHYGVWDPWTHVLYKGDTVDCWNLKDRKGTVRFARFASIVSGPVFAQYEALQEHVAFQKDGGEEVALNELQTVRVYRSPDSKDYYFFDLTIQLNCATSNPVLLLAYRYGGVGWRATADWNKDNSEVLTSEGRTRKEADGSKARWCVVEGAVGGDYAGADMMSYPGNYNYPEPLRVWPENMNGSGDMYANFSPTKDVDWPLEPGRNYVLRYRWVVFNGHFNKEKAESAWQYFSTPAKVTISKPVLPAIAATTSPADTLTAQVSEWNKEKVHPEKYGVSRQVLKGATHDLSLLDIRAITLLPAKSVHRTDASTADKLIIVKTGTLTITTGNSTKKLGPGGVALFAAGENPLFNNAGPTSATYYLFRFQSRSPENPDRARQAGGPILIDWPEMTMKPTDKGESRQIFNRPVAWLGKIDMHATTLNPGEVSHPPHTHRSEEIILMRSGHVQMHIGNNYYPASDGDLIFLSSGIPHALENRSKQRCEYFALQWQQ